MPSEQHYNVILRAAHYARLAILHDWMHKGPVPDAPRIVPSKYHDALYFEFHEPTITDIPEYQIEFIKHSFNFVSEDIDREIEPFDDTTFASTSYIPDGSEMALHQLGYVTAKAIERICEVPRPTLQSWQSGDKITAKVIKSIEDIPQDDEKKPTVVVFKNTCFFAIKWVEQKVKSWKPRNKDRSSLPPHS